MDIKKSAFELGVSFAGAAIARVANNKQLWADAKMFANDMMSLHGVKGEEKHRRIKANLQTLFKDDLLPIVEDLAGALLDALIKLAFVYAKSKAQ